jgi:hypothetical protein
MAEVCTGRLSYFGQDNTRDYRGSQNLVHERPRLFLGIAVTWHIA